MDRPKIDLNTITEEEAKVAEELELQCRRLGITDLEPLAAAMHALEELNTNHGLAVLVAAGIWYNTKLVIGMQAGDGLTVLDIDRTCVHLARVMRRDKVL